MGYNISNIEDKKINMANSNYYFSDSCFNVSFTGLGSSTPYFVYFENQEVTAKTQMPGCVPGHTIISSATGIV
jgi:archaellum component FlaF (FlaF/FlaG flagellin family)